MTTPAPAEKPLVVCLDALLALEGLEVPMKSVASASAGRAEAASTSTTSGRTRKTRMIRMIRSERADGLRFHPRTGAAAAQRARVRRVRAAAAHPRVG